MSNEESLNKMETKETLILRIRKTERFFGNILKKEFLENLTLTRQVQVNYDRKK